MYSKMQSLAGNFGTKRWLSNPCSVITTTSPFSTSRTKSAPMMSRAQVSEASTQASPSLPSTSGLMP